MSEHGDGITRRGALGRIGTGVVAAAAVSRFGYGGEGPRARVVRVESGRVWNGTARDPKVVAAMVDSGVAALAGADTPGAAWRTFFDPAQRVGLKINLLGAPPVFTAPEITGAVAAGVISAGVKPTNVLVWDRWKSHFPNSTYVLGPGPLGSTIAAGGTYHDKVVLKASGGPAPIDTIPLQQTDVTVNLPVLKDHSTSGVTLALKNIAFGCYSHHDKAHDNGCDPFIAEAYRHFVGQTKIPLIVLDATLACYDGGPHPRNPGTLWRENAIYFATDPVALDVVCRKVIMARRATMKLKPKPATHIETAAGFGLGIGDPAKIDLVTLTL